MGHNFALHHASRNGNEYGDKSCRMGTADGVNKGFNAPHTYSLGFVGSQYQDAALPSLGQAGVSTTLTAPHYYTALHRTTLRHNALYATACYDN